MIERHVLLATDEAPRLAGKERAPERDSLPTNASRLESRSGPRGGVFSSCGRVVSGRQMSRSTRPNASRAQPSARVRFPAWHTSSKSRDIAMWGMVASYAPQPPALADPIAHRLMRSPRHSRQANSNQSRRQERQIVKSWLDFGEFLPETTLAIGGLISVRSVVQVHPGPLGLTGFAGCPKIAADG